MFLGFAMSTILWRKDFESTVPVGFCGLLQEDQSAYVSAGFVTRENILEDNKLSLWCDLCNKIG